MSPVASPAAPPAIDSSISRSMCACSRAVGGAPGEAHGGDAQGAVAHELDDVEGDAAVLVAPEIVAACVRHEKSMPGGR